MTDIVRDIASVEVDPGDGTALPNLEYVLIRGFSAMGWAHPSLAAHEMIEAIAALSQVPPETGLPYSTDQARVANWWCDKGIGGGDDPIGSLISSHETLAHELNRVRGQVSTGRVISLPVSNSTRCERADFWIPDVPSNG
ncbi:hypothetical protein [Bradyrhizobium retamae]|uniref:hypothetical protein n=1 Tax=Bradyrhizobium retamae TaxID=1300035 RepID=UPI0012E33952|nr:hypothetical protein [Bradyrhizobium retamae]